jgi:hypothetical protein
MAARARRPADYFFFAAGFERLVAAVLAVFAFEPIDFDALFLAPLFALDFVAPLPALFAALFAAPFFAPVFFAAVFLAPVFFAAVLRTVLPADFVDERVLLLAFAGVDVLESPMALPAASFMRVMAD